MKKVQQAISLIIILFITTSTGCRASFEHYIDMPAPEAKKLIVEKNVMLTMSDGTKLATNIYRPAKGIKHPTILIRTSYGKKTVAVPCKIFARQGYACVTQDARGTYASEGEYFFPVFYEGIDGMDTTKWIAGQEWFDGNLGSWGISYFGYTAWSISPDNPYLKAFATNIASPDFAGALYHGGAIKHSVSMAWSSIVGHQAEHLKDEKKSEEIAIYNPPLEPPLSLDIKELAMNIENPAMVGELLRIDLPDATKQSKLTPDLIRKLNTKALYLLKYPQFLFPHHEWTFGDNYKRVSAPVLSVAGWYDLFCKPQLDDFSRIVKEGKGDALKSRLIVGPWAHGPWEDHITRGDKSVKSKAMWRAFHQIDWFDYWLKGEQNGVDKWPPIRIYVMGRNEWRDEYEWPLARTKYTKYYLHSMGDASDPDGYGKLDTEEPGGGQQVDKFDYDPANPVPTLGGANLIKNAGPKVQNEVEARPDVLVYSTGVLEEEIEVTGPITVTLYAASSGVDTDFTAKLVDVFPDGKAINIQDGIIRARYRDSLMKPSLIEPGKVYEYTIDLWATSNVFLEGHRIRLEISSSNFPRFEPNSNLGGKGGPKDFAIAHQVIHHDAEYPSHITLPVIPAK